MNSDSEKPYFSKTLGKYLAHLKTIKRPKIKNSELLAGVDQVSRSIEGCIKLAETALSPSAPQQNPKALNPPRRSGDTLSGVDRVNLIGWSYGGSIIGGYAAAHPDKVERLVMLSPAYDRDHPEAPVPDTAANLPPMSLQTADTLPSFWDPQVHCADQFDPGIRQAIWQEGLVADGVSWARNVRRVPTFPTFFWNRSLAAKLHTPTLIVEGETDAMAPVSMPDAIRAAFTDIGSPSKIYSDLACSSHFAMWETRHLAMFAASLEWLRAGTVNGLAGGEVRLGD